MFISVMRDVVLFIPSLIILAKLYGITGMLWAALIADIIAFIIAIFMVKEKKSNIVVNEIVSKNIIKDEKWSCYIYMWQLLILFYNTCYIIFFKVLFVILLFVLKLLHSSYLK